MSKHRIHLVWLAAVGCATGTHRVANPEVVATALAGCYTLVDSAGRSVAGQLSGAPPGVRLDTTTAIARRRPGLPAARRAGALDAHGHATGETARHAPTWGWTARGDSVWVSFFNGFTGTVFTFAFDRERGDTLVGRADLYFDAGPRVEQYSGIRAVRRACAPAS